MQGIILKCSTHILKVVMKGSVSQILYLAFSFMLNFMLKKGNFLVIIPYYLHFIF